MTTVNQILKGTFRDVSLEQRVKNIDIGGETGWVVYDNNENLSLLNAYNHLTSKPQPLLKPAEPKPAESQQLTQRPPLEHKQPQKAGVSLSGLFGRKQKTPSTPKPDASPPEPTGPEPGKKYK